MLSATLRSVVAISTLLTSVQARAVDLLEAREFQITSSLFRDTTPSLGADGGGSLVVYTSSEQLGVGVFGPGDIFYQRLLDGAPVGAAVAVTSGPRDDRLNDVSGDFIVFTSFETTSSAAGQIIVYQISSAQSWILADALLVQMPKVSGEFLAWRESNAQGTLIWLYNLAWLGTPTPAVLVYGPQPPVGELAIGDRFVVWSVSQPDGYDIFAYDLATGSTFVVTQTANVHERLPATSGPWVLYRSNDAGTAAYRIVGTNVDTGEVRVIAAPATGVVSRPNVDGNLVAYDANLAGNYDIYVYRLAEGDTFQLTSDPSNQYLNDAYGDLVAFVDQSAGNEDIYVAQVAFVPEDPCAALGGDSDADGICDVQDNCPLVVNADQADADGDGIGDACDVPIDPCAALGGDTDADEVCDALDNCPFVVNTDQADADGDGIGDVCDAVLPPDIDFEELCSLSALPEGVEVLYSGAWAVGDDDHGRGHHKRKGRGHRGCDGSHGGRIDERIDVAAPSAGTAVLCLQVSGVQGPGQSGAPRGYIKWNGEPALQNSDLREEQSYAVVPADEGNSLRVKLQMGGHDDSADVALTVLFAPVVLDVANDDSSSDRYARSALALASQSDLSSELLAQGCAATPHGSGVVAWVMLLGLLGLRRRR